MSILISVSQLEKQMGSKQLFESLSFGIHEREKLGLIGPNGAGKSTLLRIMSGEETADGGEVSRRKGLKWSFVSQEDRFQDSLSVIEAAEEALRSKGLSEQEAQVYGPMYLSQFGFEKLDQKVAALSGGWRKRLSLSIAFAIEPELVILDEPTNHMDWAGILWLEHYLKSYKGAFVLVSHDRSFLQAVSNKTMEINRLYENGALSYEVSYKDFLAKKEDYVQTQLSIQSSMSNKARREVEWLRAGVKARTTKSRGRIQEAHQLLEDLSELKSRNQANQSKVRLEIDSSQRLSKKLIELKKVSLSFGEKDLIKDLDLLLGPKSCLGILGDNGSGKTSLLKIMTKNLSPSSGSVFHADDLRVVYFDQKREALPQNIDLIAYLGDGSDSVVFRGQSLHVASYASRLLFSAEKMKLKIEHLSGGEQARLLIGKLLLQPADVLVLDEPTNDLDIDSIEVLEESLKTFPGLVILVSHDRSFLAELCGGYLSLEGAGEWKKYADLNQWLRLRKTPAKKTKKESKSEAAAVKPKKVKLSYMDKRQWETIESDIETAELELEAASKKMEDPEIIADPSKLQESLEILQAKQKRVEELYETWNRLEEKMNGA